MISSTSQYALRALVALAGEVPGTSVRARELAVQSEVPPSYLYKILSSLRRAGILVGTRGSRGGYSLARDPTDVHLIDVISLFEVIRPREACLIRESHLCSDTSPCSAHRHWRPVHECYVQFLMFKTIADLTNDDTEN